VNSAAKKQSADESTKAPADTGGKKQRRNASTKKGQITQATLVKSVIYSWTRRLS